MLINGGFCKQVKGNAPNRIPGYQASRKPASSFVSLNE